MGESSKGPADLYYENETGSHHKVSQSKGHHKKVVKLTYRNSDNHISKVLIAETHACRTNQVEKRKMGHSRRSRE